ncbi:hypothetical protein QYS48_33255 [Marivirga arenosa]|uniref:PH domain-containing protein n=1 Tax=Marivirga arenosa TaxID=3059076 RepID=A0AA51R8I7_9BACT|nr:hypothetical protein [Marivirga sp. ABR2-2]WMN06666.1 hypothetical protein QYS48_33255 [Marivirga sp. ABR2-2]
MKNYSKRNWRGNLSMLFFSLALIGAFAYVGVDLVVIAILGTIAAIVLLIDKKLYIFGDSIIIKYTFLPFIPYKFLFDEIAEIQIIYQGGKGNEEVMKIHLKRGRKKTFKLNMGSDFQMFVNDLRKNGIKVDASRHPYIR